MAAFKTTEFKVSRLLYTSISVDFSWDPVNTPITYTIDGDVFPYVTTYSTSINTPITFSAEVSTIGDIFISEYLWNFGDGNTGYGISATHTYELALEYSPIVVSLEAIDSLGRKHVVRKPINLRGSQARVIGRTYR